MLSITSPRMRCWICPACGHANGVDDFNCDSDPCRQARLDEENSDTIAFGVLTLRAVQDGSYVITAGDGSVVSVTPRNGRTMAETAAVAQVVFDALCGR